jgi:hypothetical protein
MAPAEGALATELGATHSVNGWHYGEQTFGGLHAVQKFGYNAGSGPALSNCSLTLVSNGLAATRRKCKTQLWANSA